MNSPTGAGRALKRLLDLSSHLLGGSTVDEDPGCLLKLREEPTPSVSLGGGICEPVLDEGFAQPRSLPLPKDPPPTSYGQSETSCYCLEL